MALTGCGTAGTISEKTDSSAEEMVRAPEEEQETEEETGQAEANEGSEESPVGGYEVKEPEGQKYTWQEYTITLPEDWVGRCVMEEHETGFSIYQKASYEIDDTQGYICGFFHMQELEEYGSGNILIAFTEDGMFYYMVRPMDVACDTEDEKILGEYIRMCQQVPEVKASLQIAASGVHGNADEYMFAASSILGLDQEMLADFSDNSLWIARNEIYARHGRQFDNMYLQQYFNRCTWYKGDIPAQEFQESVLNQTEKDNIQLLHAAEQEYDRQHPYPKMYQASEVATVDLNGDGAMDEIAYQVMEQE
ncbi:MAG: YARHG domain-containing protein, partial [Acetatifactor sp.]|nr:YARHG domain-containing protein [Acetatifactor sp.]